MAGHSKWSNIKHRKAAQDAKRGKAFTKIIREIVIAARMSGDDVSSNPRLGRAVNKALGENMKRKTIDDAIKRGTGGLDGDDMMEIRYEGYGPGGVAVLVECMTDNKNRTVSEVRHAFAKSGGNLGTDGSVAYLFSKQGILSFEAAGAKEDAIMDAAIEAGAEDVITNDDDSIEVITSPADFESINAALIKIGFNPNQAEIIMQPAIRNLLDRDTSEKLLKLIDTLEDCDDVQEVFTNAELDPSLFEE